MNLPNVAQRVFHTPLIVAPAKAAAIVAGLGPKLLGVDSVEVEGASAEHYKPAKFASILDGKLSREIKLGEREGYGMRGDTAVIPITNTLIHRGAWIGSWSGETSYEGISAQIEAAASDSRVRKIALEIDSYGGEVAGCFTLANTIRKVREEMPVHAFVADHAFSAAYALASQAGRITIPKAGGAGSIGVICLHMDRSAMLEDHGLRVTIISAGDHKGDGNPYEPLPDDVRENMQREMETLRGIFVDAVSGGRGDAMSSEEIMATEAACYLGEEAVEIGLADQVADPAEAFEEFVNEKEGQSYLLGPMANPNRSDPMADKPKDNQTSADDGSGTETQANGNTAPVTGGGNDGKPGASIEDAVANAVKGENERMMSILDCDEAKGKQTLARSLSGDPTMSLENAKKHLAAASPEKPATTLSEEMTGDDADLDTPEPEAGQEKNPLKAALSKKYTT